ncbi:GNAT family N-acetyltransferase, partial [Actinomyces sp. S6-Spd3]
HESWAVVEEDTLVGLVCVSVDEENLNGWFWYWMAEDARGRGWMSRAAATVANWALTTRGLERLELGHRVNNPASGAVARRAGFIKEGTERQKFLIGGQRIDVDTYGRLASDPQPPINGLVLLED